MILQMAAKMLKRKKAIMKRITPVRIISSMIAPVGATDLDLFSGIGIFYHGMEEESNGRIWIHFIDTLSNCFYD